MSLLQERPAVQPPATFQATTTRRRTWAKAKLPLALLALIVAVSVLLALGTGASSGSALDPTSYTPDGARAVATLLAERGSPVSRVDAVPGGARSVVVPDSALVDADALHGLLATARDVPVLIVVTDDDFSPDALGVSSQNPDGGDPDNSSDPGCALPAAVAAGQAKTGDRTFDAAVLPAGFDLDSNCYGGSLLALRPRGGSGELLLVGSSTFLQNRELGDDGDAALALGLIDHGGPVSWLQPHPGSGSGSGDGSTTVLDLLPHRLKVAAWELAVVALLLGLWRSRRLGPVVREQLPVRVRSAETVRGRARLYRGAGARDRAALALREGTRARLATRLGLGPQTGPAALVAAVAARSGRSAAEVGRLLYGAGAGSAPADDAALVRLAEDLDTLAKEAQR